MADAGKILPQFTHIEIDEKGQIWLIQNHFESDSVIMEMESTSKGVCIIDDDYMIEDYMYDDGESLEDYL